jgi:hypothetical protein
MDIPNDLIHAFESAGGHGVVAFVGSGPSCDAGVPGWSELIRRVAVELSLDSEVGPYLASGRFLEAAEFLSRQCSEEEVQQRIAKEIRLNSKPGLLHDLIVRVPFSGIVTTNYDLLLSTADQQKRFDPPVTYRNVSVKDHYHRRFVLHMHGHIGEPTTIVLSRKGYDEIVAPEGVAARQFLFNVLGGYSVLFIGFGFRDLNVDMILREGEQVGALGYTSLFGLVPSTASVDRVFEQNLKTRRINPIYLADAGDYGKDALCKWLSGLSRSVEGIARAHRQSARSKKPRELLAKIEAVFLANELRSLVPKAMAQLKDRPDLDNWARKGFGGDDDMKRLFEEVSVDELRQILVMVNRERRNPVIEDALSCFPPEVD